MAKAAAAKASERAPKRAQTSAQSTTAESCARVLAAVKQDVLARESGLSEALISRMLTRNVRQRRRDPKYSTMCKLQRGLLALTGERFPLDAIGEAIAG